MMRAGVRRQSSRDTLYKRHNSVQHTPVYSKKRISAFPGIIPFIQRKPLCPCDGGCPRCMPIQTKLKIGKPNDKYEQEADRVADRVMRMPEGSSVNSHWSLGKREKEGSLVQRESTCPDRKDDTDEAVQTKPIADQITPLIQRQEETKPEEEEEKEEEEEPVQPKRLSNKSPQVTPGLQNKIQSLRGGGHPLPKSVRNYFEPRFGRDFSSVRVHTDAKAADAANSVNAKAFTTGKDMFFGPGKYSTETTTGIRLLAHELTHVVQQDGNINRSVNIILRQPLKKREVPLTLKSTTISKNSPYKHTFRWITDYFYGVSSTSSPLWKQLVEYNMRNRHLRKQLQIAKQQHGALFTMYEKRRVSVGLRKKLKRLETQYPERISNGVKILIPPYSVLIKVRIKIGGIKKRIYTELFKKRLPQRLRSQRQGWAMHWGKYNSGTFLAVKYGKCYYRWPPHVEAHAQKMGYDGAAGCFPMFKRRVAQVTNPKNKQIVKKDYGVR